MVNIFSILLLIVSIGMAQDVKDIIDNVQETYDAIHDLSASFQRVESFQLTGTVNETGGELYIKDGEKYRFESDDQTIVTDGKNVWTYNALNNQLIIDRLRKNSGALLPRDMLYKYPKEYYSTLLRTEKNTGKDIYVIKLDPQEGIHGFVKSMKIWVEDDSWLVHKIETTDLNGNKSLFIISKIQTQMKLADSLFSFKTKPEMNVVDMR